ncbi:MAG TPA: S9 family peptidase [Vicinamibacterales bacterium]|nr:S9 family peptidase [Vicinamibacterales bacterium]
MLLGWAAVVTCGLAAPLTGQARRAMTVEDLIVAPRIADPQLSPDGRTVLFVRTTTDGKTGQRNADIYAVPADGSGEPKELIGGVKSESTPRWSPDGKRIAFLSNRDGATQLHVAGADGGGVRKVTNLHAGAQAPFVWSPDGSKIAFVSDVYPECTDEACNKKKYEEADANPVKVHRLTRLLYRHWDEWRDNVRHHVFVTDVADGKARDLTPGDFDSPPTQQEDGAIAFSPDSRTVAFVSNREGRDKEAWTTNNDIFLVPVEGGELRQLTQNPAADTHPVFSRDGRTLYALAQRRASFESDRWYLDAYDIQNGSRRTIFTKPDLSVSEFALGKDDAVIWFTAGQEARTNLFTVAAVAAGEGGKAGAEPKRVLEGGSIGSINIGSNGVVFSMSSLVAPPEVYRVALDGAGLTPLTRANEPWMKAVAFSQPESLTVQAGGGPVQYWLIKPPNFEPSQKYPILILVHGGPQGVWGDAWSTRWNPSLWAAQGWVVAAPNPSGSTTFGQAMVDRISGDWAGRVMTEIDGVVAAVAKMPFTDSTRMGIAGASYGGYAVNWILGQQPGRYKAAVSHDGVFNLESMSMATEELWFTEWEFGGRSWDAKARAAFAKQSPHLHAHKIKTPTLIITNELDYRVPVDQGLQMFTVLRRNGVPSEALVFPDEGHWVLKAGNSRVWHEAVFGWLKKYL